MMHARSKVTRFEVQVSVMVIISIDSTSGTNEMDTFVGFGPLW